MVRAASASASVPISSITMTSGMWFSTASIITSCCCSGVGHLHAPRAADARVRHVAVAGDLVGGVDDHHALASSSASTRATSRSMVVLPTPGRPSSRMTLPICDDVAR